MSEPSAPDSLGAADPLFVDGVAVVAYSALVARLGARFPGRSVTAIEAIVQREYEAFTGGRPLVVPADVEGGAIELLSVPIALPE